MGHEQYFATIPEVPRHVFLDPLPENYRVVYRRNSRMPEEGFAEPNSWQSYLSRSYREEMDPCDVDSVVIRVRAVSVNSRDISHHTDFGRAPEAGIPCSDAAGEIVVTGANAGRFLRVGTKVCTIPDPRRDSGYDGTESQYFGCDVDGVLASHITVHWRDVVAVPPGLDWPQAACLPTAGLTAWNILTSSNLRHALHPNARSNPQPTGYIVLNGTSDVAMMALHLALKMNCQVLVTSPNVRKRDQLWDLFRSSRQMRTVAADSGWGNAANLWADARGADIVLHDSETLCLKESIDAVRRNGTICLFGHEESMEFFWSEFGPQLQRKSVALKHIEAGSRQDMKNLTKFMRNRKCWFEGVVGLEYEFENANAAFRALRIDTEYLGNIVIVVPPHGFTKDNQEGYPVDRRNTHRERSYPRAFETAEFSQDSVLTGMPIADSSARAMAANTRSEGQYYHATNDLSNLDIGRLDEAGEDEMDWN